MSNIFKIAVGFSSLLFLGLVSFVVSPSVPLVIGALLPIFGVIDLVKEAGIVLMFLSVFLSGVTAYLVAGSYSTKEKDNYSFSSSVPLLHIPALVASFGVVFDPFFPFITEIFFLCLYPIYRTYKITYYKLVRDFVLSEKTITKLRIPTFKLRVEPMPEITGTLLFGFLGSMFFGPKVGTIMGLIVFASGVLSFATIRTMDIG